MYYNLSAITICHNILQLIDALDETELANDAQWIALSEEVERKINITIQTLEKYIKFLMQYEKPLINIWLDIKKWDIENKFANELQTAKVARAIM